MEIPVTKLRDFYNLLKNFRTETQLNILEDFNRKNNYKKLVEIYSDSKNHFDKYSCCDSFISDSKRKDLPKAPSEIKNTNDLISILEKKVDNYVSNSNGLDFIYLNREISTLRTTGNVKFESGQSGRSSGTGGLDFIGWNTIRNIPILGEVKVKGDENPFYAIIQLLTYLSELSTPNQIERINNTNLFNSKVTKSPFFLYVVLSNYNHNSSLKKALLNNSVDLAQKLKGEIMDIYDIAFLEIDEPNGIIKRYQCD